MQDMNSQSNSLAPGEKKSFGKSINFVNSKCQIQFKTSDMSSNSKFVMSIDASNESGQGRAFIWDNSLKLGLSLKEALKLKLILDSGFLPQDKSGSLKYGGKWGKDKDGSHNTSFSFYHQGAGGSKKSFSMTCSFRPVSLPSGDIQIQNSVTFGFMIDGRSGFMANIDPFGEDIVSLRMLVNWVIMSSPVILGWSKESLSMQDVQLMVA